MKSLNYTYNGAAEAIKLVDSTDNINFALSGTYAPTGELTGAILGSVSGGFAGFTITNAYNDRLQPILLSAASPTATVSSECFDFHLGVAVTSPSPCSFPRSTAGDNGNVYQIVNNRTSSRSESFNYDSLNRVANAQQTTGTQWGESYTTDAWGNMTAIGPYNGKPSESLNTSALANNQLSGFGYDAAGNMTSNGSTSYVYDAENRLVWTSGYRYVYDGHGERVEKCQAANATTACPTSGTTGTLYWRGTGSETLAETDLGGNDQEEYLFFNGQRIARRDTTSTGTTIAIHYYFSDHLGSHGVVENATGTVCEQDIDYYPYGGVEHDYCPNAAQSYKFTGKERDSESSLDYFGMRHYASTIGRFMQTDEPFADQDTGDPQSWNMYAYVVNNPLRYTDPNGLAHTDANGYWVGDYNGECGQQNGSTVCWNAKANNGQGQWQPKLDNGAVNPGFLGPLDIFFFRVPDLGIMSKLGSLFGRTVEKTAAETAVKTFGEGVTKVGSNALLKDGTKAAARDVIDAMADSAQKASLRRGLQAAGSQAKVSLQVLSDGSVKMIVERPGFSGAQQIIKTVAADGSSKTVQTATDAAGTLVHYDPKN